jgi:hypothetical protein
MMAQLSRTWTAMAWTAAAIVLALAFLAYLRPSFLFDLTNQVLIWCG